MRHAWNPIWSVVKYYSFRLLMYNYSRNHVTWNSFNSIHSNPMWKLKHYVKQVATLTQIWDFLRDHGEPIGKIKIWEGFEIFLLKKKKKNCKWLTIGSQVTITHRMTPYLGRVQRCEFAYMSTPLFVYLPSISSNLLSYYAIQYNIAYHIEI